MAVELESELESDSFGGYDSVIALLWSLLDRSTRHEGDKEEYGYFASFHLVVVLRVYRSAYESVNCGRWCVFRFGDEHSCPQLQLSELWFPSNPVQLLPYYPRVPNSLLSYITTKIVAGQQNLRVLFFWKILPHGQLHTSGDRIREVTQSHQTPFCLFEISLSRCELYSSLWSCDSTHHMHFLSTILTLYN